MNKFIALIISYPLKLYIFEYSFNIMFEKGLFSAIISNKFSMFTYFEYLIINAISLANF